MGLGYYQLRMVGGIGHAGTPSLRILLLFRQGMENRCKPCGRSDDHLCGRAQAALIWHMGRV